MNEQKYCIVVICNNENNIPWIPAAKNYLQKCFDEYSVDYHFIENLKFQTPGVHPSWYKLLAHRHLGFQYDYCLCWDLDLLPTNKHSVGDIIAEINFEKFYACHDTGVINSGKYFTKIDNVVSNFRWNCGLLGIPKYYSHDLEGIYETNKFSKRPSWEQYYMADYLYDHKDAVVDGNPANNVLIEPIFSMTKENQLLHLATSKCIHYSIRDPNLRTNLIIDHSSKIKEILR